MVSKRKNNKAEDTKKEPQISFSMEPGIYFTKITTKTGFSDNLPIRFISNNETLCQLFLRKTLSLSGKDHEIKL